MASRNKAIYIQVGVTKEQREVFDLMTEKSPFASISKYVLSLIENEIHRVVKFDEEILELMINQHVEMLDKISDGAYSERGKEI